MRCHQGSAAALLVLFDAISYSHMHAQLEPCHSQAHPNVSVASLKVGVFQLCHLSVLRLLWVLLQFG